MQRGSACDADLCVGQDIKCVESLALVEIPAKQPSRFHEYGPSNKVTWILAQIYVVYGVLRMFIRFPNSQSAYAHTHDPFSYMLAHARIHSYIFPRKAR